MIRLTNAYKHESMWVNPQHIVDLGRGMCAGKEATFITTICDESLYVTESPEEVARKVLEWRLVMERYRVALSLEKPNLWEAEERKLKQLAGLEE